MKTSDYSADTTVFWLRGLAGTLILAGIIATIVIWNIFGSVEVSSSAYRTVTEPNPSGIILAIATGFQALLLGVFLLVFAKMVESVWRIEAAITTPDKPESAGEPATEDKS